MSDSRREIEEVGEGGYDLNNGSISSGDRVSTVINHALWFWPHQGISTEEIERYHIHQRLSPAGGGWCPGLVVPKRMRRGPGPTEPPDVCSP